MQEEREQLSGQQIVVPFAQAVGPTVISVQGEVQDGVLVPEDSEGVQGAENEAGGKVKGSEAAPVRGKGRPRGRGRGRGKGETERGGLQEAKGRGRGGKKIIDGDGERGVMRGEEGVRGKLKVKGRGRPITVVTTTTNVPSVTDLIQDADGQVVESVGELMECLACSG